MSDCEHGFPKASCFEGGPGGGATPGNSVLGQLCSVMNRENIGMTSI